MPGCCTAHVKVQVQAACLANMGHSMQRPCMPHSVHILPSCMSCTHLVLQQVRPKLLGQLLLVDKEGVGQLLLLFQETIQQGLKLLGRHVMWQI